MIRDDIKEFINFSLCFITLFFLIVGGFMIIGYNFDKYTCGTKGDVYGIDTEYNISGCYAVLPEGKMLIRHYEEQTQRTQNIYLVK